MASAPPWAEAIPAPATSRPPAIIVMAAAFFTFFTTETLLAEAAAEAPQHALENARAPRGMRHLGDIHTTV
ncbi:hypothetical protein GCM10010245_74940 [Streptomyces spectabilis]|nr:hypothetical protein GCM10010245_74940 [Streptomyces spectabilis]